MTRSTCPENQRLIYSAQPRKSACWKADLQEVRHNLERQSGKPTSQPQMAGTCLITNSLPNVCPCFQLRTRDNQIYIPFQSPRKPHSSDPASSLPVPTTSNEGTPEACPLSPTLKFPTPLPAFESLPKSKSARLTLTTARSE